MKMKIEMKTLFRDDEIEVVKPTKFCLTCAHREHWLCGASKIQYCGIRKSNRTFNGLMKIQAKFPACAAYKQIEK